GLAAASDCGAALTRVQSRQLRAARGALQRAGQFQQALWSIYAGVPITTELADTATVVCRCEEVRLSAIAAALDAGATGLGSVKRATRLGMGRCQGRYCGPLAAEIISRKLGREPVADDMFAPRTPLRPLSISAIAGLDLQEPCTRGGDST
ncbi:MAG: (2Fe-2S)-binding protein, partial [Bosea sp. (in: a-proteobacteria)]